MVWLICCRISAETMRPSRIDAIFIHELCNMAFYITTYGFIAAKVVYAVAGPRFLQVPMLGLLHWY